ncbi:hypothetical protein GLW08_12645 [Pontibacillus yanchengensis]|uniref:Uncharacterized protein n=1 Tax=Pontibacillus yanchengensis TaxID=462910 RepID=A0ACC7VGX7_9BACI|nr:hypothetical protein [Pontibacillus yanchengensis]MYL54186.1 hypothetical protein [Pontibacillus yanchengensis]
MYGVNSQRKYWAFTMYFMIFVMALSFLIVYPINFFILKWDTGVFAFGYAMSFVLGVTLFNNLYMFLRPQLGESEKKWLNSLHEAMVLTSFVGVCVFYAYIMYITNNLQTGSWFGIFLGTGGFSFYLAADEIDKRYIQKIEENGKKTYFTY